MINMISSDFILFYLFY